CGRGRRSASGLRREVTLREGAAGARLQVALECERLQLGRKLDNHDNRPGTMGAGVPTGSAVVPLQSLLDIAGGPDVIAIMVGIAAENVDEPSSDSVHKVWRRIDRASGKSRTSDRSEQERTL